MIELTDVELSNVVYFKKAKLDITRHPFVVITGHNKDSRISTETSNGAGKSLLFSSVPNLRYEQTPLASQKSKKDMLSSSASSITLGLKGNDGKSYKITQTASKFVIERDGTDIQARTINIQKAELERIFPISEEEFYSYIYLQSQRPLAFQIDKPAARLHYITSVFRLDVYDQLKKFFTRKLGEIKNKQVEFDVLNNQLIKINSLLERLDWSKEKAEELEAAQSVIKSLSGDAKKLQTKIERLKAALAVSERHAKLTKQRKALKPKLDLKSAKAELELHELVSDYKSEYKTYIAQREQLTTQIAEIGETKPVEKLEKQIKKLNDHQAGEEASLTMLHEARQFYKQIMREVEEATAAVKETGAKLKNVDVIVTLGPKGYEDEIAKYSAVLQLESIVDDCADGECPTCQQSVNIQKFKKQIAEAKEAVKKAKQGIKKYRACKELFDLQHKAKKHEFDEKAEQEFLDRRLAYKATEDKLEKLQEQLHSARQLAKLNARLDELTKPKKPKKEPKYPKKQLLEILEQHSEIKRIDSVLASLEEQHGTIDPVELSNSLEEAEKRYAKIERKYVKAQDTCSSLGSKASEYKVLRRERKDAIESLKALEPIIAQRGLFKSLEKAYGKELKVYAANQVLAQIEQNLNRYSNLIFAEPFKFAVHADDKGVHCVVDRGNGKKSDVRLLSGAESDCFRLLFFYVMLIMVDDTRRTNFAVLDEPDSHMDDTTRSLFIERFIPALRTLVPHVFLITPLSKHAYSECAYVTVVKHKGVSKLVEDR
jgi:DNA repair exonuclease SbcCD ATPase subunit